MTRARGRLAIAGVVALVAALAWSLRPTAAPDAVPAADDAADAAGAPPAAAGRLDPADARLAAAPAGAAKPPPPPSPAGRPPESDGPRREVVFVGRVVDEERRPEPDAVVRFESDLLTAAPTRTDARGAFRVVAAGRTGASLVARAALHVLARGDRAAVADANFRPLEGGEEDVGTIEVTPTHSLRVRARADAGVALAGAFVRAFSLGGGTRAVEVATAVLGADGEARLDGVPTGRACVWVGGQSGAVARESVVLPQERPDLPLDVVLRPSRTLRVEVYEPRASDVPPPWNDEKDVPVPGAVVRPFVVEPGRGAWWPVPIGAPWSLSGPPPTAADGTTAVLVLPADASLDLAVEAVGRTATVASASGGQGRVVVRLARRPRTVFLVQGVPPADGTRLSVTAYGRTVEGTATREGVVEGGRIEVLGDDPFEWGIATAPDGRVAVLERGSGAIEGRATAFAAARRLVVRLLERGSGAGIAGVDVVVGETDRHRTLPVVRTDAAGTATFAPLFAGTYHARAFATATDRGIDLGVADLSTEDGTLELRFEAERTIAVRSRVDGERRLPSDPYVIVEPAVVVGTEEDGTTGTIRVRARPRDAAAPGHVWLRGRGVLESHATFAWPAAGATLALDLAPETACAVDVEVRAHPARRPDVFLERETAPGAFTEAQGDARRIQRTDALRFERMRAGRYRLRDGDSDAVTEVVELRGKPPRQRLLLDLAELALVRGRVEGPPGTDFAKARILVLGPGIEPVPDGFSGDRVGSDGAFDVLVLPGKRTTLRVWHPGLVPVAGAGSVTVDAARDDVRLRLSEGARLRARLKDAEGAPIDRPLLVDAALFIEPGGEVAGVVERALVPDDSGAVTASGLAAGSIDAWIDVGALAPRRFARLKIEDGVNDLGDVRLDRGCALFVKAPRVAGRPVDDFQAEAELIGVAPFSRTLSAGAEAGVWRAGGLCAGRWRLTTSWAGRADARVEEHREIEVDGKTDLVLDLAAK